MDEKSLPNDETVQFFAFFREIGIIAQLSRALFEARLPEGITLAHYTVLNHLNNVSDGRTPLELARAFQVPKNTMTHTLMGLERHGFIDVRPHPKDRRSKQLWLTDAGRHFNQHAVSLLSTDVGRLSNLIDIDMINDLTPQLAAIRKILDCDRDGSD